MARKIKVENPIDFDILCDVDENGILYWKDVDEFPDYEKDGFLKYDKDWFLTVESPFELPRTLNGKEVKGLSDYFFNKIIAAHGCEINIYIPETYTKNQESAFALNRIGHVEIRGAQGQMIFHFPDNIKTIKTNFGCNGDMEKCGYDVDYAFGVYISPNIEKIEHHALESCRKIILKIDPPDPLDKTVNSLVKGARFNNLKTVENSAFAFASFSPDEDSAKKAKDMGYIPLYPPLSLEIIGDAAFYRSRGINEFWFTRNLKKLGESSFNTVNTLQKVGFKPGEEKYITIDKIPGACFMDCTYLEEVKLPPSIKEIKAAAFYGCGRLKSFVCPENLEVIEEKAFFNCKSCDSFVINRKIKKIDDSLDWLIDPEKEPIIYMGTRREWLKIEMASKELQKTKNILMMGDIENIIEAVKSGDMETAKDTIDELNDIGAAYLWNKIETRELQTENDKDYKLELSDIDTALHFVEIQAEILENFVLSEKLTDDNVLEVSYYKPEKPESYEI